MRYFIHLFLLYFHLCFRHCSLYLSMYQLTHINCSLLLSTTPLCHLRLRWVLDWGIAVRIIVARATDFIFINTHKEAPMHSRIKLITYFQIVSTALIQLLIVPVFLVLPEEIITYIVLAAYCFIQVPVNQSFSHVFYWVNAATAPTTLSIIWLLLF